MEKFIEYMQTKNFSHATQKMYLRSINQFLEWINKEAINCTKKDVLKYLEYLKNQRALKNISRKMQLTGLNHYFTFLYQSEQSTQNPCSFLKIRGIPKISLYKTLFL